MVIVGVWEIKHLAMLFSLSQIDFFRLSDVISKDFQIVKRYNQALKCPHVNVDQHGLIQDVLAQISTLYTLRFFF